MNTYSSTLDPNDVLGLLIFSHRHAWDGTICQQATEWNCGSEFDFRERFCGSGNARCHVISTFASDSPSIQVREDQIGWLLANNHNALDNEIVYFYHKLASEPAGIPTGRPPWFVLAGAYRVKKVEIFSPNPSTRIFRLIPNDGEWTDFPALKISPPPFRETTTSTTKLTQMRALQQRFEEAAREIEADPSKITDRSALKRFENFHANLPTWLEQVAEKRREQMKTLIPDPAPSINTPFEKMTVPRTGNAVSPRKAPSFSVKTKEPKPTASNDDLPQPLISNLSQESIRAIYGQETLVSLRLAVGSGKLVILRGPPGSGKSHLARELIDVEPTHRLIVPVASTWRGTDDLLGYVNPVSNEFEPTAITDFLMDSSTAWQAGDRRNRVVVFEEFNLSQPEYWFSDLLVRLQYPPKAKLDRTIQLGGSGVRGKPDQTPGVYLPPSLRFVATMNHDHTTRPLSPRILDRSAVVELDPPFDRILKTLALQLPEHAEDALRDLDFILRSKMCTFSFRAAKSLQTALTGELAGTIAAEVALDVILMQEVFPRLRFLAGDPLDESIITKLEGWSEKFGGHLPQCKTAIARWRDALEEGRDVVLA